MATKDATQAVQETNQELGRTLGLLEQINKTPAKRGQTKLQANLEEELKRRRLTTNDPT